MVGWHHRRIGLESKQALGVGDEQGSLACCSPLGGKEWETTEPPHENNRALLIFRVDVSRLGETVEMHKACEGRRGPRWLRGQLLDRAVPPVTRVLSRSSSNSPCGGPHDPPGGFCAPGPQKARISFFKNLVNISKSRKCANCCPKDPLLPFLFRCAPAPGPTPPTRLLIVREQAIYVPQMFTFSKDTSKSAHGALPGPANT